MVRIIRNKFPQAFENNWDSSGKWVLTDDCPRQSFKQVLKAYNEVRALPFKIPRRFFVLNPPLKNVFGLFTETLIQQALKDNIVHKTYQEFVERVKNTMLNSSATK